MKGKLFMKKILSIFLAASMLVLAMLLAACGDKKDPDVTTDGTKQTTESTSATSGETTSSQSESTGTTDSTTTYATDTGTTVPGG